MNNWLRNARKEIGLSQIEMAQCIGVSRTAYQRYECGSLSCKKKNGQLTSTARAIASFFGIDSDEIFGEVSNKTEVYEATLLHSEYSRAASAVVADAYDNVELRIYIDEALGLLSERDERILRMRFGLVNEKVVKKMTVDEVANILGVRKERVRPLEAKAIRRLRSLAISRRTKLFRWFLVR